MGKQRKNNLAGRFSVGFLAQASAKHTMAGGTGFTAPGRRAGLGKKIRAGGNFNLMQPSGVNRAVDWLLEPPAPGGGTTTNVGPVELVRGPPPNAALPPRCGVVQFRGGPGLQEGRTLVASAGPGASIQGGRTWGPSSGRFADCWAGQTHLQPRVWNQSPAFRPA